MEKIFIMPVILNSQNNNNIRVYKMNIMIKMIKYNKNKA